MEMKRKENKNTETESKLLYSILYILYPGPILVALAQNYFSLDRVWKTLLASKYPREMAMVNTG